MPHCCVSRFFDWLGLSRTNHRTESVQLCLDLLPRILRNAPECEEINAHARAFVWNNGCLCIGRGSFMNRISLSLLPVAVACSALGQTPAPSPTRVDVTDRGKVARFLAGPRGRPEGFLLGDSTFVIVPPGLSDRMPPTITTDAPISVTGEEFTYAGSRTIHARRIVIAGVSYEEAPPGAPAPAPPAALAGAPRPSLAPASTPCGPAAVPPAPPAPPVPPAGLAPQTPKPPAPAR